MPSYRVYVYPLYFQTIDVEADSLLEAASKAESEFAANCQRDIQVHDATLHFADGFDTAVVIELLSKDGEPDCGSAFEVLSATKEVCKIW